MKVLIIGGVAAGTKVAAKIRREDPSCDVTILTKSKDISYAGCGLPYLVSGVVGSQEELIVNTPEKFTGLTLAKVINECEVTAVDFVGKSVTARKGDGEIKKSYDKLVITVGASPIIPNMEGKSLPGVFSMRSVADAQSIKNYVEENHCKSAVVAGAGFIGLEIAENLQKKGLKVTVVDLANQIMPNVFDKEMADFAAKTLRANGLRILTSSAIDKVIGEEKAEGIVANGMTINGEVVVMALGIRPNTAFLADTGLEMDRGAIVVDEAMRTNIEDVYAAGDCVTVKNRVTNKPTRSPMGSTANISGRILAKNIAGADLAYNGALGTGVIKLMDGFNAGRTGLTEAASKDAGYNPVSVVAVLDDKPHYMGDASTMIYKVIADKDTGKLLGMQVLGGGAVDKFVDVAALGISAGMKLSDYDDVDFAYAPPFSTAINPFVQAIYVLENKISGAIETMTPVEYLNGAAKAYQVIDVLPAPTIAGAKWVDLNKVTGPIDGLDKDAKLLLCCAKGKRGYLLQNRLRSYGYTNTKVLEGGITFNNVKVEIKGTIPADEVKRVKGLGCLQDKRNPNNFNVRVITRNGKITTDEHKAIAEAAEIYGSGEVTMTTRLTLEIQGVPFANIEPLIEYLNERGLETGGTGSKVRPVVSCKGTTCQYGLIDTFGLSEKLHDEFYTNWHNVILPHKFKLAVGGCPNNCVKPTLNDLGIIGQRVPVIDYDKCRGCKVCQVEKNCPIKVATVVDGKITIPENDCNHCGRCVGRCPFHAIDESTYGYRVYIGGRWGKRIAHGQPLNRIFTSEEDIMALVEKAILLFRDEGITGERFSDTIERLGFDYVEDKLLNGKIDKEEVLKKNVVGGAKC